LEFNAERELHITNASRQMPHGKKNLRKRLTVVKSQRYIINRVSYQYLDPEAAFQLLLFVKTQVTSGGIW
jgi:hypothetical protein